jgi:hypothetical protein
MTGAESRSRIAMEIFEEQQVVPPMRVILEFLGIAIDRSAAILIALK